MTVPRGRSAQRQPTLTPPGTRSPAPGTDGFREDCPLHPTSPITTQETPAILIGSLADPAVTAALAPAGRVGSSPVRHRTKAT
jgi:hypothetical protein